MSRTSKSLKQIEYFIKKNAAFNIKMTKKKTKQNKTGNEKIRGVASLNKIASQRSLCTVCTSRKSIF